MPSIDTQNGSQTDQENCQDTPLDIRHSSCLSVVAELRLNNGRTLIKRGDTKETLRGDLQRYNYISTGISNISHMENDKNDERQSSTATSATNDIQKVLVSINMAQTTTIPISQPPPPDNIDLGNIAYRENGGNARSPVSPKTPTQQIHSNNLIHRDIDLTTRTISEDARNDMAYHNAAPRRTL